MGTRLEPAGPQPDHLEVHLSSRASNGPATPLLEAGSLEDVARALTAAVETAECLTRFDPAGCGERAAELTARARSLGLVELSLRGQLVTADVLARRGEVSAAGRLAQTVQTWASEHGARLLLARSHYVLDGVFTDLGDVATALEHAVRAVDLLDDDAPPTLRLEHLMRLADCIAASGDNAGARERYPAVLRMAEELGDVDRQMIVLNNWAHLENTAGEPEEALRLSMQLQAQAQDTRTALHLGRLDTVARALMGLGRHEEAEELLLPALDPSADGAAPDRYLLATGLLTLAEVQRCRGALDLAQRTLTTCLELCAGHGLTSVLVPAHEEQARLHAAAGRYREAYEQHRLFHAEAMELQSAERDARARALQVIYETGEARRQSRQYRELSLRDALTGLYNRRYVDDELPRLVEDTRRAGQPLTVALVDLDHFKLVNDTCSHDVGDRVLQAVAGMLEPAGVPDRRSFAARMGGEEFLIVLCGQDVAAAEAHLQAVCRTVRDHPWASMPGGPQVTVSIGAAARDGSVTMADLVVRADAQLYRAKSLGRDRVVVDRSR